MIRLILIANTIVADVLVMQGDKSSALMVLTSRVIPGYSFLSARRVNCAPLYIIVSTVSTCSTEIHLSSFLRSAHVQVTFLK